MILISLIDFVISDEFVPLICEDYNTVNLYMIRWFISTIRVGDSRLKYWCIMKYTELDHRKKIIYIKLTFNDEILHTLYIIALNPKMMVNSIIDISHFDLPMSESN